ncbi:ATP citrate synthase, partial [candidate division WWE3 bacterium]|nr:ATP citrate synthase [candidate division WWE3 bacterium]
MEDLRKDSKILYYSGGNKAIQSTLDFDHACGKEQPSLVGVVKEGQKGVQSFFWGAKEILLPVYPSLEVAFQKNPDVVAVVNFSSKRSAEAIAHQILDQPTVKYQIIIAEGIPERAVRMLRQKAKSNGQIIYGPSIFGVIKAGVMQLGPAGGGVELQAKANLHKQGAIGVVTKSGGLVNEFAHIVANTTGNLNSIIAIGGDRYPCIRLAEVIKMYEHDDSVKMIVMQGEIGGIQEIEVAELLRNGEITKPLVAWTSGTAAEIFPKEFQFGHAGAQASNNDESAISKNALLKQVGAFVPDKFEDLHKSIIEAAKSIDLDLQVIGDLDYIAPYQHRQITNIISTITDDRGEEPKYYNRSAIQLAQNPEITIADVIGLLWFRRELPPIASDFINLVLKLTADHGPNVAGAHNTIVTARAGKDIASALASGILTIGPRFGGASGEAAKNWFTAVSNNIDPRKFVNTLREQNEKIPGIGHRYKSKFNPDRRVMLLSDFAKENLSSTHYLTFAQKVEEITLQKNHRLILNIDGTIGAV